MSCSSKLTELLQFNELSEACLQSQISQPGTHHCCYPSAGQFRISTQDCDSEIHPTTLLHTHQALLYSSSPVWACESKSCSD